MNITYYSQEDPRWKNTLYSITGDRTQTIGTSACGPTCMAMVISTFTDQKVLPTVAASYAINNKFRTANSGTSWSYFGSIAKKYGLNCTQTGNLGDVKTALGQGSLVIASMGKGNFTGGGHYILLTGIKVKDGVTWIDVLDPNHDNTKYGSNGKIDQGVKNDGKVSAQLSVFSGQAKQYWIIDKPNKEEDEPMTAEEKKQFDELKKLVEDIARKLNVNGDQTYASNYATAVAAAKKSGAIKTSADKSKYELNIIQMLFNMGLFKEEQK